MPENFLLVSSMRGSAVTRHFPFAAEKATIDSHAPFDLGYSLRNGAERSGIDL